MLNNRITNVLLAAASLALVGAAAQAQGGYFASRSELRMSGYLRGFGPSVGLGYMSSMYASGGASAYYYGGGYSGPTRQSSSVATRGGGTASVNGDGVYPFIDRRILAQGSVRSTAFPAPGVNGDGIFPIIDRRILGASARGGGRAIVNVR